MHVEASLESRNILTYPVGEPDRHPMFFEKRVYQGSSGKVYPIPFIDKVYDEPVERPYQVAILQNEYVYLEMLPEIGGRIFKGQDKTNDNYDFFYRQDVIKPALVGLAGPWISGGVEFNWPQHHRPDTFMPADVFIEEESDGARTVWMSSIDPISRLKGLYGIRLRPGSAVIELRARLHNRTTRTQSFLWWANVAARVHDHYQSFFPPDVHYVADHAVRAMSSFPLAMNPYYGIDYSARPGANDLTWYKNIPVPTSYMVCETRDSFFGGYDFEADGGFLHVANRHIAPGKKQWTWGNAEFGWAWDRELTDNGGPYVELMAGVYTDNQPDFSYLLPTEEKHFSQFWWPFQKIGPVQAANEDVALRLVKGEDGRLELGAVASRLLRDVQIELRRADRVVVSERATLAPDSPWQPDPVKAQGYSPSAYELTVSDAEGHRLLSYRPKEIDTHRNREQATEPPRPSEIATVDEMTRVGEHLDLYRHPTRMPEDYWKEALEWDGGDYRGNLSLGKQALERGLLTEAQERLKKAIARQTARHPNPESGEAFYFLGVALQYDWRPEEAYDALYKATWNYEWRSAGHLQLARINLQRGDLRAADEHAREACETNARNHDALILQAAIAHRRGQTEAVNAHLKAVLDYDPLEPCALALMAVIRDDFGIFTARLRNDAQTILDVAFAFVAGGMESEAIRLLHWHHAQPVAEASVPTPLSRSASTYYLLAKLAHNDDASASKNALKHARRLGQDWFFPSRLEEQLLLEWIYDKHSDDPVVALGLGNYYYDRRRHDDAISAWENCTRIDPLMAGAWRNLGIAYWNTHRDGSRAQKAYVKALEVTPEDARLVFEADQLNKKLGVPTATRLSFMQDNRKLVLQRDDASVELATLLNDSGHPDEARKLITGKRFHPWEGGEGKALGQYKRSLLALAEKALQDGDAAEALLCCDTALNPPDSLGEQYHPLQNQADIHYWRGMALRALDREPEAVEALERCAATTSDFQQMAVVQFSELSVFAMRALKALGRTVEAKQLEKKIRDGIEQERKLPARIDYFATSLPNLLVFDEDMEQTRDSWLESIERLLDAEIGS